MAHKAIIDASPLIGLALVGGLVWLPKLFGRVFLPESVKREVLPEKVVPGKQAIAHAIAEGWVTI